MKTLVRHTCIVTLLSLLAGSGNLALAGPLGTAFTYQGRLTDAGNPANGTYDLRFIVYDAEIGGSQKGSLAFKEDVLVTDGLFTVDVDFGGNVFTGDARWLEVAVRPGPSTGLYTTLSPRRALNAVPYALYAQTPAGPAGPQGATGATGPQGVKGDTGDPGIAGPQGLNRHNQLHPIRGASGGVRPPSHVRPVSPPNRVLGC